MYARRLSLPAIVSMLTLLLLGSYATPARADVDLELVAETVSQEGYYVDSGSKFLKSDDALDRLRRELEAATSRPVFVTVVPAGAAGSGLSGQVARAVGRKGTYAALVGTRLEATSTALPKRTVDSVLKRAVARSRGNPEAALIEFTRALNRPSAGKSKNRNRDRSSPERRATPTPQETVETELAQNQREDDGNGTLLLIVGAAALAVAGIGGYLLWKRRRRAKAAASSYGLSGESASAHAPGADSPHTPGAAHSAGHPPASDPTAEAGSPYQAGPGYGAGSPYQADPPYEPGPPYGNEPPGPPSGGEPPYRP